MIDLTETILRTSWVFSVFSFVTEYIKVEVITDTASKKIYSSEKSRCKKQVPLFQIKRNALASFSFPVFLKVLNTEGV